jgi:hypothetical protein
MAARTLLFRQYARIPSPAARSSAGRLAARFRLEQTLGVSWCMRRFTVGPSPATERGWHSA